MSLRETINRNISNRHFLIVPSFNPERRHSWASVVSHLSVQNSDIHSSMNLKVNTDFIR